MTDFTGIPITHPPGLPTHSATPVRAPETPSPARHAAQEFESVFLTEMMQPMFEGIGTDGIGEGGDGEQMFRPMLIEQYAAAIAKSGGVGIADNILHELTRMQSAAPDALANQAHALETHALESRAADAQSAISRNEAVHGADR